MPQAKPLFTILLPTHNRADVLRFAIRSILRQSCQDFELFIVGDGCTDHTAEVVAEFADDRIRWFDLLKQEGFGYANRNTALEQASGALVAFAADDDLMLPDHLERMADAFERRPQTYWAYSRPLWVDDEGTIMPFFVNLTRRHPYDQFMQHYNALPAGCVVHRRECFEKAGMWPTDMQAQGDWALWRRIIIQYGQGALHFLRTPSHLHFRAHWRDPKDWAPRPLAYLKAIAGRKTDWPPALQLALPNPEKSPQEQVLALLEANATQFVVNLREGVATLEDDIAWEATLDSHFY